jgi:hypothetical protein
MGTMRVISSDVAYLPAVYLDVALGRPLPWSSPPSVYFFPDGLLYILSALGTTSPGAALVVTSLAFLGVYLTGAAYLARSTGHSAATGLCLATLSVVALSFGGSALGYQTWILSQHGGAAVSMPLLAAAHLAPRAGASPRPHPSTPAPLPLRRCRRAFAARGTA